MRVKAGLARRDESAGQHVPVHGLEADQGRGVERAPAGAGLSRGTVSQDGLGFKRLELAFADRWEDTVSRKLSENGVLIRCLGRAGGAGQNGTQPPKSDGVALRLIWRGMI